MNGGSDSGEKRDADAKKEQVHTGLLNWVVDVLMKGVKRHGYCSFEGIKTLLRVRRGVLRVCKEAAAAGEERCC